MSSSDQDQQRPPEPATATTSRRTFSFRSRGRTAAFSAGLLIIGAVVGAGALRVAGGVPRQAGFVLQPSPIASLTEWTPAAIKGQVAEIFGNKFIIQDASGRALIETGREGEGGKLVAKDEAVTVQGRFEHGFLHASFIVHGDGKTVQIDSPHGPGSHHHGPLDWLRHGHAAADSPVALPSSGT